MYGYRNNNEDGLVTNLNSISSSLSSIDTVSRRTNVKSSADNLLSNGSLWKSNGPSSNGNNTITKQQHYANMNPRYMMDGPSSQSVSGQQLANGSRHLTGGSVSHYGGSEIYYSNNDYRKRNRSCWAYLCCCCCCCFDSVNALNTLLIPLILLTITRQVFDFIGQIWLQILINFFTIIIVIVALFGLRQPRISYIVTFSLWASFNTIWNILVGCIHTKCRDLGFLNEGLLSLNTGALSWWYSNHPGCLPYNITSSIQPTISIVRPSFITSCTLDYHVIEASQAMLHAAISFIALLVSGCAVVSIRKNPAAYYKKHNHSSGQSRADKVYRLNNLMDKRTKINSDPYPSSLNYMASSRFNGQKSIGAGPSAASATGSLRRATGKNIKSSSRSSQHSMASVRSARRRASRLASATELAAPTPRGSSSSMQASQKYGSLSSRRSSRKDRRSDISSMTYGTTSGARQPTIGENPQESRNRLSSQSSVEYLPSYQPPHSSSANLLSSYGEISSIDSYNNHNGNHVNGFVPNGVDRSRSSARNRQIAVKSVAGGNANPTYVGSRSSICSRSNTNNYDDISYIYSGHVSNGHGQSTFDSNSRPRAKMHDSHLKMTQVNNQQQAQPIKNPNQQQAGIDQRPSNSRHPIYSNQLLNGNSETPI